MSLVEAGLGRLVAANNERIAQVDPGHSNPRPIDGLPWAAEIASQWDSIRSEWDRFSAVGGRLPLIEELIDEHQGNEGAWRAGLLVSRGRPREPLASVFPGTVSVLGSVPGLRSALWSQMDAGTELPEHQGPNAGVLRYHLGVRCGTGSALKVNGVEVPYRDSSGVLFDDTVPHSAWNRGTAERVTLFCELERPLPPMSRFSNRIVQAFISLDPRYRRAPIRAMELHRSLNLL